MIETKGEMRVEPRTVSTVRLKVGRTHKSRRKATILIFAPSSSGRTLEFDSRNRGSNPRGASLKYEKRMNIFQRYFNYLKTWRKHREVIKALNALSTRELDDIGISRADINDLVWLEEDKAKTGK